MNDNKTIFSSSEIDCRVINGIIRTDTAVAGTIMSLCEFAQSETGASTEDVYSILKLSDEEKTFMNEYATGDYIVNVEGSNTVFSLGTAIRVVALSGRQWVIEPVATKDSRSGNELLLDLLHKIQNQKNRKEESERTKEEFSEESEKNSGSTILCDKLPADSTQDHRDESVIHKPCEEHSDNGENDYDVGRFVGQLIASYVRNAKNYEESGIGDIMQEKMRMAIRSVFDEYKKDSAKDNRQDKRKSEKEIVENIYKDIEMQGISSACERLKGFLGKNAE